MTSWSTELMEARGSGSNVWLRDPDGGLWLYKATRAARVTGTLQGEDWAEKAVERLAILIGVPTARVELATVVKDGQREVGVISRNLAGGGFELQGGATLLTDVPGYRYRDSQGRPPRNRVGHSVPEVQRQLAAFDVAPTIGFEPSFMTAFDIFAGYLMLDAWIGNQDRHEENWAVLRDGQGSLSLAPSFDHGASLGFVLTEDQRIALVGDAGALAHYAGRGCAKRFDGCAKVPLTVVAADALRRGTPRARDVWLSRLAGINPDGCRRELAAVPRMSDASRTFCLELLETNRRRLLDECQ